VTSTELLPSDGGEKQLSGQTVSEVGVFRLTATPPTLGYFGETVAAGTSVNIGRFYPASFLLTDPLLTPACSAGFTYAGLAAQVGPPAQLVKDGQPFGFSGALSERNLSGGLTGNYTGTFAKLTAAGLAYADSAASSAGTVSVSNSQLSVPGIDGNGYLDYSTKTSTGLDSASFLMASAIAPYSLKILTTATDSDGVTGSVTDILSGSPLPDFRLGQARISNAHGSELQALRLPITVGHFNGSGYAQNPLDSCTVFNAATLGAYQRVSGASPAAPVALSYLNSTGTPVAPFVLSAGSSLAGGYLLSAPGAGNDGNVRLTYTTPTWLQFDWDGNGTLDSASALATFGIYRGATPLIFRRELYRSP
jgi:MSHA biogenesis protein MshQ